MELIIRVKVVNDKSFVYYFLKKINNLLIFILSCAGKSHHKNIIKPQANAQNRPEAVHTLPNTPV